MTNRDMKKPAKKTPTEIELLREEIRQLRKKVDPESFTTLDQDMPYTFLTQTQNINYSVKKTTGVYGAIITALNKHGANISAYSGMGIDISRIESIDRQAFIDWIRDKI